MRKSNRIITTSTFFTNLSAEDKTREKFKFCIRLALLENVRFLIDGKVLSAGKLRGTDKVVGLVEYSSIPSSVRFFDTLDRTVDVIYEGVKDSKKLCRQLKQIYEIINVGHKFCLQDVYP